MTKFRSERRFSYELLKDFALYAYFDYCRDRAIARGMPQADVLAQVDRHFEEGFERPLEDLMWQVILLVLSGSWDQPKSERQRARVSEMLKELDLEECLRGVLPEEKERLLMDLKILELL